MPLLHAVEWRSYPSYTDDGKYEYIEWTPWVGGVAHRYEKRITFGVPPDYAFIAYAELREHFEELHECIHRMPWSAHLRLGGKDRR